MTKQTVLERLKKLISEAKRYRQLDSFAAGLTT
ncbi:hypothetical protein GFC30_3184 (plasmid) [Anoxybacillus amylolyticus]|uniref:Uncharacterized protein n=1 Tax=Anoxybacteroides amylolyticum TaxID=294699 RepID=A0A160F8A9_9BACL|nr:hypothetical protein GFC30_3184 [Anoxybacillus amylolyticus]